MNNIKIIFFLKNDDSCAAEKRTIKGPVCGFPLEKNLPLGYRKQILGG
jgi:hypothetical protein